MADATYEKLITIISPTLFSGSSDALRTAFGGYWVTEEGDDGDVVEQTAFARTDLASAYLAQTYGSSGKEKFLSDDSLTPTYQRPVRVVGVTDVYEGSDLAGAEGEHPGGKTPVPDDNFWKVYWSGGTFGGETYSALIDPKTTYTDCWFGSTLPYPQKELKILVDSSEITTTIEVSYDYNFYLQAYQQYVDALSSELLIPNMYLITMFNDGLTSADIDSTNMDSLLGEDFTSNRAFDSAIGDFVGLEGTYADVDSSAGNPLGALTSDQAYLTDLINSDNGQVSGRGTGRVHVIGAPGGACDKCVSLYDFNLHEYLSGSVVLTPLSASTEAYVENALQNVMFDSWSTYSNDNNLYTTLQETQDKQQNELFPYYAKIKFTARSQMFQDSTWWSTSPLADASPAYDKDGTANGDRVSDYGFPTVFAESLVSNNYSAKFLKILKESFVEEIADIAPTTAEYIWAQTELSSSEDSTYDSTVESSGPVELRTIDYLDLLSYGYANYTSQTDNLYYVGERSLSREVAMDSDGTYKYLNSVYALGAMGAALDCINNVRSPAGDTVYPSEPTLAQLLTAGWSQSAYSSGGHYKETIAYRIEKIGGAPTGDSQTQNVLQNFWIFSSPELINDVVLYDTQIKYGENYTYKIYKYEIVVGMKYKYSDLVLSRITNDTDDTTWVEFYDPVTGEVAESAYEGAAFTGIDHTESNTDYSPYLADFLVTMEPIIKVYEVPMFTKTINVIDHPPNQVNLNPFFFLDSSQTVGYNVDYETFIPSLFPTTISAADVDLEEEYLNANDMLAEDEITLESRSQQRYLQVYRLSEMPTAYTDFDNHLISTIDLKLEDSIFTLPSTIFYDKINTNQKYYYLFRVLNENMVPGQLSEIYEAELINDGGYIYGMFDLIFETDLEVDNFVNPSEAFKRFIQLQPHITQIEFDDSEVDYDASAIDQLSKMSLSTADDPIWDKTFKIRLTSKKTGKKIDLNVTYKYSHDSN